jgi:hypothetical protein
MYQDKTQDHHEVGGLPLCVGHEARLSRVGIAVVMVHATQGNGRN